MNSLKVNSIGLITAGSQPYGHDLCIANGTRFAYSATLATYIYELNRKHNEYLLNSIVCNHSALITSITWHPHNQDLIATSSTSSEICIWNIKSQQKIAFIDNLNGIPSYIQWNPYEPNCIVIVLNNRNTFIWNYEKSNDGNSMKKFKGDDSNFESNIVKFRFHPKNLKLAFGHDDGSMSIIYLNNKKPKKHILRDENIEDNDELDPILALEWDVLSNDYILVASKLSGLRLLDSEKDLCISTFQLPSKAIHIRTLAWITDAPGLFLTGDSNSGILRIWNVSKQLPLENFQLKRKGFLSLSVLKIPENNETQIMSFVSNYKSIQNDDTSSFRKPLFDSDYAVPKFKILASFADGGTGLYDFSRKEWDFFKEQGHLETIFDCKFNNFDNDIIATASFDGSVKLWSISKGEILDSTPLSPDDGIIYSCSWSPNNSNQIAASTGKNGCFIWDFSRKKIVHRFKHANSAVYCISWNQHDSKKIAASSADGNCVIYEISSNGVSILTCYKHPSKVYGCDWSPTQKEMIATACDDKKIRVFYLSHGESPLKIFSGHTAKVFSVKWSPILDGIFCSSSDDCKILIWDYSRGSCIASLEGHLQPVRALLWHTEIPYILISGSWDSTIKVWDTRSRECIETLINHVGDIYGLTSHPSKPFVFASASRDSTIRLWNLSSLFNHLYLSLLVERPWNEIMNVGSNEFEIKEKCLQQNSVVLLFGRYSKDIKIKVEMSSKEKWLEVLKNFSEYFLPINLCNMWSLFDFCMNKDDSLLESSYYKGIVHWKHITKATTSVCSELMISLSTTSGILTSQKKIKSLEEAADYYLKSGNIQKYCEIMISLNEWERALAIAPGVSLKYWQKLMNKYIRCLKNENSSKFIPFSLAIGNIEETVDHYTKYGQYKDALIVSAAYAEGSFEKLTDTALKANEIDEGDQVIDENKFQILKDVYLKCAEKYIDHSDSISATCCFLAVDDYSGAMNMLLRGNELELVFCLSQFLNDCDDYFNKACIYLARRAEGFNRLDLSIDLLNRIKDINLKELSLTELCCRFEGSDEDRNDLYFKCDLPTYNECKKLAKKLNPKDNLVKFITYNLLSNNIEISIDLGRIHFNYILESRSHTYSDLYSLVNLLNSANANSIDHKRKTELMCMSYYMGLLLAIRKGYNEIVNQIFECLKYCLNQSIEISLDIKILNKQQRIWSKYFKNNQSVKNFSEEESDLLEDMFLKADLKHSSIDYGSINTIGSHLPSNSNAKKSLISGQLLKGSGYLLEDKSTTIELNEALMWSRICPYSPLCTGFRIDCF